MTKGFLGWVVLVIAVTIVLGGGYYFYQTTFNQTVVPAVSVPEQPQTPAPQPADDLNRRRQEGIGSIKNLKPVQIPPAEQKTLK